MPAEWPIVPVLIVDHTQDPSAEPYTTNAAELRSLAESNLSSTPSRIETDRRPVVSSNASASTRVSPSPLLIRPVSPSSPLQEDWSLRDKSFEMGPISPEWTTLSDGALSPRWEKQQQKRNSSSGSILKEPKLTVYHIYQKKSRRHYTATTKLRRKKKRKWCWSKGGGCGLFHRKARISEKEHAEAIEKGLMSATSNTGIGLPEERWDTGGFPLEYATGKEPEEEEEEGYFWHQPGGIKKRKLKKVRTFRKGVSKENSTILAEIPGVWFWKRWNIKWREESDENARKLQQAAKSWSMPAEEDVLSINSENPNDKKKKKKKATQPVDPSKLTQLKWADPLSKKTRQYTFTHGPLTFHWKGTSTVRSTRPFKAWCRYNHLKLVAEIPTPARSSADAKAPASAPPSPPPLRHTLVLATYVSDADPTKPGTLTLRDDAIADVWRAFIVPSGGAAAAATPLDGQARIAADRLRGDVFAYGGGRGRGGADADVKDSRFWDVIVATGLCMIFGEWQKRETIRQIIQTLASGAGAA